MLLGSVSFPRRLTFLLECSEYYVEIETTSDFDSPVRQQPLARQHASGW